MRELVVFAICVLCGLLAGCGYPPEAGYVTDSPPPATNQGYGTQAVQELTVTQSAATGVVFLVYAPETFSGTRPATDAKSLDETVLRVLPATSEGTVDYGSPDYTGRVFVLVGVNAGTADVEVSRNGGDTGRLRVTVVPQTQ